MTPERFSAYFVAKIHRLAPELLEGLPNDLKDFIRSQDGTDTFTSFEMSEYDLNEFNSDPQGTVLDALICWTDDFIIRLDELLGSNSSLPGFLTRKQLTDWQRVSDLGIQVLKPDQLQVQRLVDSISLDLLTQQGSSVILVKALFTPETQTLDRQLITVLESPWRAIVRELTRNWERVHDVPSRKWEELIAGAFEMEGFDHVSLTPRSGDFGRDVIAIKDGVGSVRIIDSMKAYRPGRVVGQDEVHALAGVLSGDPRASKAIMTTTSVFAPRIRTDPYLAPMFPYKIELMDGEALRRWLEKLIVRK